MSLSETVAILALAAVLGFAVARPRDYPEAVAAVPAAALVIVTGGVSFHAAWQQLRDLLPVVVFLVAVLSIGDACDAEGLFTALGDLLGDLAEGRPVRLLRHVFVVASVTTAVLSLDATVILLTPIVVETALRARVSARPHVYACTHLANSGSLLLPVSNLTNLLAFAATGLSFVRFGTLMTLPWLVAIVAEYAVFRRFFAADLRGSEQRRSPEQGRSDRNGWVGGLPVVPLVVVAVVLAGFAMAQPLGIDPMWCAVAGAVVLAGHGLVRRRTSPRRVLGAAGLDFAVFVLGLGIVVGAVAAGGLGQAVRSILPTGGSFLALLAIAAIAAVLANVVNNLPAMLLLLPLLAGGTAGPGPVLAALIGVNVGPNLTYVGSLATLLWRRALQARGVDAALPEFLALGAATVPVVLVVAVVALWCSLALSGR